MTTNQQLKLIITALLVALAGTIYYYNFKKVETIVDDSVCMDYKDLNPSTLKTGLIGDMVHIYRNNQLNYINSSGVTNDDAYSIWFDLDTIKKFIYHIEKGVEQNTANTDKNRLGIRFYYAAYPEKSKWILPQYSDLSGFLTDPKTQNYDLKHTLVLLPTINVSGNDLDFNPFVKSTYTSGLPKYVRPLNNVQEPVEIDTTAAAKVELFALTPAQDAANPIPPDEIKARNHGAIYPPGNTIIGLGF